jgi:mRNA interferase YafQ
MLHPSNTTQFERDKKKALKQGKTLTHLCKIMERLIKEQPLEPKYCDHPLKGNWKGFRDCHIENDWLLIYKIDKKQQKIVFARLGTHSELFKA